LYVVRAPHVPSKVIFHVSPVPDQLVEYEAPLDDNISRMIEGICVSVVKNRASCIHTGRDGAWYLLTANTPQGTKSALTWSPHSRSQAASVVDVFSALRAYATAPDPVRLATLNTLYRETYASFQVLGLFETKGPR
jgi:hypothetical protein